MTAAPAAPSRTAEAEALGAALPALLVASDQLAATVALGAHGRRRAGLGDAFWQYRPAQPADPVRMIDWRRSARGDQTFVREREAETAQTVMLWIDRSRAMAYSGAPNRPPKAERAALLGLALAALMLRAGERVGLMADRASGADADPAAARRAAPRSGRTQLLRLAEAGDPPDPAEYGAPAPAGLAAHGQAVLISDFLGPFAPIAALMDQAAAQGVRGALVQILDPAEEDLPFAGRTIFESMGGAMRHETRSAADLRALYGGRLRDRRAELELAAGRAGFVVATHRTDAPAAQVLLWLWRMLDGAR
ncbi:MAG: hypothetical protein RL123_1259 [Pseudomonadota bacterium]